MDTKNEALFFDAYVTESPALTVTYRTGMTTYTEGLRDGILVSLGWNGAGYIPHCHGGGHDAAVLNPADFIENQAFELELDGQALVSHWECTGVTQERGEKSLTVRVCLRHKLRPAAVTVCTLLDGSPVLSRWLEIENLAACPSAMGCLSIMSGGTEMTKRWKNHIKSTAAQSPYRLGYFKYTAHMHEGMYRRMELPGDCFSFGSRYSRLRYRHPFFTLENLAKGTTFIAQLAYSGGYRFAFDVNHEDFGLTCDSQNCLLSFKAEAEALSPMRVIDAGEKLRSPELHIGIVNGDLDEAVNGMHEHVRRSVMYPQAKGRCCWVETAGCGSIKEDKICVDRAAELGYDILYIDAGWYYPNGMDALGMTGTWQVDPGRYPNGIGELRDYCHSKGLLFGLWMEPERIGSLSDAARTHGDMVTRGYNDKNNGGYPTPGVGGLVDLARPEAAAWVESEMEKMIRETGVDMFRLDFNHVYNAPYSYNMRDGYLENCDWRYNETFYGIIDRLRGKFPDVVFENCASGGGRTDLGTVKRFCHTWVTDNPINPRTFDITNGMTMCLPPELIDRLVTTMDAHSMADLDMQLRQLLFVRPTVHHGNGCGTPLDAAENPVQQAHFKRFLELYKSFVTPFQSECKIYHHTPECDGEDARGYGILEEAAPDGSRAMLALFRLSDGADKEVTVRFRGVDETKRYAVVFDNGGKCELEGTALKYKGLTLPAGASLTSELILASAID